MDNNYIMQKKLDLYEKFFEEMQAIEQEEIKIMHDQNYIDIYKNTRIEDNFICLDESVNLLDLNMKEQSKINEQNNLHNYEKIVTKINKFKSVYDVGRYMISIPRWIPFT